MPQKSESSLKSRLARAAELEAKLSNSSNNSNDSKIRYDLCEILSDILLTDPSFGMRKDCPGRLWRGCFYGRISQLRSRIAKEKRKHAKIVSAAGGEAATNTPMEVVQELEKNLHGFLREAVFLYDFLVKKYEEMIVPPAPTTTSQSQGSSGSQHSILLPGSQSQNLQQRQQSQQQQHGGDATAVSVSPGVIPTLHRLLIYLGDLHRYADSLGKAEASYERAAQLAPGKGNPYNQLGVVAQLKKESQTCVSLYWYCRSLMATHDPFDTSKANLTRLFTTNQTWLLEHPQQQQTPNSGGDNGAMAGFKNNKKGKTGNASQEGRNLKSAISKHFLATFVEVQRHLFYGVQIMTETGNHDETKGACKESLEKSRTVSVKETKAFIVSLMRELPSLLGTAFSDSLLVKLIAICAFSVSTAANGGNLVTTEQLLQQQEEEQQQQNSASFAPLLLTGRVARALLLQFGARVAERVELGLGRLVKKLQQEKHTTSNSDRNISDNDNVDEEDCTPLPTLRFLLPLVLVCDFVSTRNFQRKQFASGGPDYTRAIEDFLSQVCSVANILVESSALLELEERNELLMVAEPQPVLKDYESLRGFVPFASFVRPEEAVPVATADDCGATIMSGASSNSSSPSKRRHHDKSGAFLSAKEASGWLGLTLLSMSQDSGKQAGSQLGASGGSSDTRLKMKRLLAVLNKMASSSTTSDHCNLFAGQLAVDESNGKFIFQSKTTTAAAVAAANLEEVEEIQQPQDNGVDMEVDAPVIAPESAERMPVTNNQVGAVDSSTNATNNHDEAGDVLVYKPAVGGTGPSLLVPSFLLGAEEDNNVSASGLTGEHPSHNVDETKMPSIVVGTTVADSNLADKDAIMTAAAAAAPSAPAGTSILPPAATNGNTATLAASTPPPPPGFALGVAPIGGAPAADVQERNPPPPGLIPYHSGTATATVAAAGTATAGFSAPPGFGLGGVDGGSNTNIGNIAATEPGLSMFTGRVIGSGGGLSRLQTAQPFANSAPFHSNNQDGSGNILEQLLSMPSTSVNNNGRTSSSSLFASPFGNQAMNVNTNSSMGGAGSYLFGWQQPEEEVSGSSTLTAEAIALGGGGRGTLFSSAYGATTSSSLFADAAFLGLNHGGESSSGQESTHHAHHQKRTTTTTTTTGAPFTNNPFVTN